MQKLRWLSIYFYAMLSAFGVCAQKTQSPISIPFRVGDKFGVVNDAGFFFIKPQFDWINISPDLKILTGFIKKNDVVLSSLIYQNKVLLQNQYYRDYNLTNGLFTATRFKITDEHNPEFSKRFTTRSDVFTIDGKKLIDGNFTDISIMNGIDHEGQLDQVLVSTTDTAKRESVFLYDRKLKAITKKYITNTNYLRITNNSDAYYKNRSYTIVYKDEQGTGHQLQIVNDGKALMLASDKAVAIPPDRLLQDYGGRTIDFPENKRKFKSDTNAVRDTVTRVVNTYAVKSRYYFYPKALEQLKNTISLLNGDVLITKNGKRGLSDENTGSIIIPIAYDDVVSCETVGTGGYVLRIGNTFQAVYYDTKPVIIPTIFNKIPVAIVDYLGKGRPLIKLYDNDGRFFCYAKADGKLYYREK